MTWPYIVLAVLVGLFVLALGLYVAGRWLEDRQPYSSFMRLRTRQKLTFFRLLLSDRRVPRRVKLLPFLLVTYLVLPIDIIPDFIPVLGYLDDVAVILITLALVIRWTPQEVVQDILCRLDSPETD